MKYLFINSISGSGSTGRIVAETCRKLIAQGHECCIAFGRGTNGAPDIPSYFIGGKLDAAVFALENRIFDNEGFAARRNTRKLLEFIRSYDPDVIWIHNVHGYYLNMPLLFGYLRSCGKEIRWMLHDCWTMTGHCAYFDYVGCERWKTECHHCPDRREYPKAILCDGSRRNYRRKKELFAGIPNLTLIVPSHWLEKRVKASFLKDYPVEVVYNTVDTSVFRPVQSDFRKRHGLEGKKMLLGVANVWDRRKGLEDFRQLSAMLDDSYKIVLIGLNEKQIASLPAGILRLPRTANIQELVEAYSAADLYICPGTEETFGMTVLEAACCGTRTVVYKGTACEEVARQYGDIAVERGAEHLYEAVMQLLEESK